MCRGTASFFVLEVENRCVLTVVFNYQKMQMVKKNAYLNENLYLMSVCYVAVVQFWHIHIFGVGWGAEMTPTATLL